MIVWLVAISAAGVAQTWTAPITPCHRLAEALTNALQDPGYILDSIEVRDKNGDCDTLVIGPAFPGPVTLTINPNGTFTIRVRNGGTNVIRYEEDSHPLVADLNAWLDEAWAMELQNISQLSNQNLLTCSDPQANVPYFTRTISNASALATIDTLTGARAILDAVYVVMGQAQYGRDFLSFALPDRRYIVNRANALAKLAEFKVEFDGGSSIHLTAQTWRYNGQTCGSTVASPFGQYIASIVMRRLGYGITTPWCEKRFTDAFGIPNNNPALLNALNNNNPFTGQYGRFGSDTNGFLTYTVFSSSGCPDSTMIMMRLADTLQSIDECEMTFCYSPNGVFSVDPTTGEVVYRSNDPNCPACDPQPVPCLACCKQPLPPSLLTNVIVSGAQTYSDDWPYDIDEYGTPQAQSNVYEAGYKGRWRSNARYVYRELTKPGSDAFRTSANNTPRSFKDAGVYPLQLFDWKFPESNDTTKWLQSDTTTLYSPSGEPLEEMNVLGMYSSASFGHSHMLPITVAQNAQHNSVLFESFEEGGNDQTTAHTGKRSNRMNGTASFFPFTELTVTEQMLNEGVTFKLWLKTFPYDVADGPNFAELYVMYLGTFPLNNTTKIAQTGEWSLHEITHHSTIGLNVGDKLGIGFTTYLAATEALWVDDFRAQPPMAKVACNVYDPTTFKLVATFDDPHFAQYYQYNAEGKLVRILRESERGLMTIKETQYHLPEENRDGSTNAARGERGSGSSSPTGVAQSSGGTVDASDPDDRRGIGSTFDLLDIEIGADRQSVEILGAEGFSAFEEALLRLESIREIDLPDAEKLEIVGSLRDTRTRLRELESAKAGTVDGHRLEEIEIEEKILRERQDDLLERSGLSLEDVEAIEGEIETLEEKTDPDR